ncbi:hypothetical protein P691DRAFT_571937 [Macrolepiota fuliginosa MF-IS2]|uniref:Uncharacterized protein n=1 Tax=Macrolepiota fuliginosa MF-IS2 TaxID=1400762 RepID=A0A9P5XGE3_9AGAR|nr:hypothetical protein P691DRAFT_571937 [Macrolepiota fuliginosa MF-IS2]
MWKSPIMTFELAVPVVAAIGSTSLSRSDSAYTAPSCSATSDWTWMYNQQEKPPCLTASFLVGACITKGYTILKLPAGFRYDPPSSITANICLCSWAVYNLYGACSLCQDQGNPLMTWDVWTTNCSNFKSDDR